MAPIAAEIEAALQQAATLLSKSEGRRLHAGQLLAEIRRRVESREDNPARLSWWEWYRANSLSLFGGRSRRDAEKLLALAGAEDPEAAAEEEREKNRAAKAEQRERENEARPQPEVPADVRRGNGGDPEAAAEAMKEKFAALDGDGDGDKIECVRATPLDGDGDQQPSRQEVAKLVRAWVTASPEVKREFVRQRWDEIQLARKEVEAAATAEEDRWIEGDDAR